MARIARGDRAPGARGRAALLQPGAADGAGRGDRRADDRPRRGRRARRCSPAALGKTPVLAARHAGLHRQPRGAARSTSRRCASSARARAGRGDVDAAMRAAGFRMGPFELIDAIGADVNLAVSISIWEAFVRRPALSAAPAAARCSSTRGASGASRAAASTTIPTGREPRPWGGLAAPAGRPAVARGEVRSRRASWPRSSTRRHRRWPRASPTPEAIDTAMRLGTNYPHGPLAWGERIGLASVVGTLDALHAAVPDGRYRVDAAPALAGRARRLLLRGALSGRAARHRYRAVDLRHGRPAARHRAALAQRRGGALPPARRRVHVGRQDGGHRDELRRHRGLLRAAPRAARRRGRRARRRDGRPHARHAPAPGRRAPGRDRARRSAARAGAARPRVELLAPARGRRPPHAPA